MDRSKPTITSTTHILPFERLSPLDFEWLCLWLVEREGYVRARHLGLGGSEKGRDVVAHNPTPQGQELWYLQDEDAWVRKPAAKALGQLGGARAVEPLLAALKKEDR